MAYPPPLAGVTRFIRRLPSGQRGQALMLATEWASCGGGAPGLDHWEHAGWVALFRELNAFQLGLQAAHGFFDRNPDE